MLPLLLAIQVAQAAPVVTAGAADFANTSLSVRYRSFRNTGGREIYTGIHDLGVVRTSGAYRSRQEVDITWASTATITVNYDPSTDQLSTTVVTGGRSTTQVTSNASVAAGLFASAGGLGALDAMQGTVAARDVGTTVSFTGVTVNGASVGSFSAAYSSAPTATNWADWTLTGIDFAAGFVLTGTISTTGTFSYAQENGKVQLLLGELNPTDSDGDGDLDETDCAPTDPTIYTGAPELCNALDDDCDGVVDDSPIDALPIYTDGDGDGYGDLPTGATICPGIEGYLTQGGDCDDADPSLYPGAPEFCDDGIDQDCDGVEDNSCDLMEITIPATFSVSTRSWIDEDPATLGTQVIAWVERDYAGVAHRVAFLTDSYVFTSTGLNGAPINIGRTAAGSHGDPDDAFISCGKAFAAGPNTSGVEALWTPTFNLGSTKTAAMYTYTTDTDGDGVDDATEVSVNCTNPASAASH